MPALSLSLGSRRLVALVLIALVGGALLWQHTRAGVAGSTVAPAARAAFDAQPARRQQPSEKLLVVDVAGAVRRAGLVRLPAGSRVADAVARAGGFSRKADRDGVNLAAPISDGQQVVVPARGAVVSGAVAEDGSAGTAAAAPVSLSAATAEQLDTLPGVGPVTAQKIVQYRTEHGAFHAVDELDAIPGIGPARIEQLRGLVVP
jgi:competence protein ComEA